MGDVTAFWVSQRVDVGVAQPDVADMMAALRAASHLGDRMTMALRRVAGGRPLHNADDEVALRESRSAEIDRAGTDYLLNICTLAEWRVALQAMHKRHHKEDELIQVREGFYDIVRETLARVNADNAKAVLGELHLLREHTNDAFKRVQAAYSCVGTRINPDWSIDAVRRNGSPTGGRGLPAASTAAPVAPAANMAGAYIDLAWDDEDEDRDDEDSDVPMTSDDAEASVYG